MWDLRGKREVAALAYGGGAGTLAGGMQGFGGPGFAVGGRRGMSDVAWHPDNVSPSLLQRPKTCQPLTSGYSFGHVFGRRHVARDHGMGPA